MGSSGKTETNVNIPAKTPEEIALLGKQSKLIDLQIEELGRQNELLAEIFPSQKELLHSQIDLYKQLLTQTAETPDEAAIRQESTKRSLAILRGEAPPISAEQAAQIDTYFGAAKDEGTRSIKEYADSEAAARGLRATDSPIGNEGLRQTRYLAESLEGQKALAKLNVGQSQQVFTEGVRQFQEGLRQQSFQNRLALASPGASTPFVSSALPSAISGINDAVAGMRGERIAGAKTTTYAQTNPGALQYIQAISGLVSGIAGGVAASSARLKKDITPLDRDEYDRALDKVVATPITRWRYKWEPDDRMPHIGPILELSPEEIRDGPLHVSLIDYAGLQHAALKAVERRVRRLEGRR